MIRGLTQSVKEYLGNIPNNKFVLNAKFAPPISKRAFENKTSEENNLIISTLPDTSKLPYSSIIFKLYSTKRRRLGIPEASCLIELIMRSLSRHASVHQANYLPTPV